jgi:hypothetical protein
MASNRGRVCFGFIESSQLISRSSKKANLEKEQQNSLHA